MTTRVRITCPDNSHWHVKVTVQDQVYDHDAKVMTDTFATADSFLLKQTESRETYLTSTRRLLLEEVEPAKEPPSD